VTAPTPTPFAPAHRRATTSRLPLRRVAAAAAGGFLVVSCFQVALALGAPFGAAAFGGANAGQLPPELRLVSAVAAGFWLLAALHALTRGGFITRFPGAGNRRFTWALAGVTAVGSVMNLASSSPWERFGWAPCTLILAVLCLVLAKGGRDAGPGGQR
jgi:hypothetical protein